MKLSNPSFTYPYFTSHGERCACSLYLPADIERPPVVIMAHGFGGERRFRLPAFAERFQQNGFAVLLFDYRGFGDSEGSPRQLISVRQQLQDWRAAIDYTRSLTNIDPQRIALWGTSFSGGHVLKLASEDSKIAAVVSQVPFAGGLAVLSQMGLVKILRFSLAGICDLVKSTLLRRPHPIAIYGSPNDLAILNTEECEAGYGNLVDSDSRWENQTPARILLNMPLYAPARNAEKIQCPVLITGGNKDSLIPIDAVRAIANRIPQCQFEAMDCNHFDPYYDQDFEDNIALQIDFIKRHLNQADAGLSDPPRPK